MKALLQIADLARRMAECYHYRVKFQHFAPGTDPYVRVLLGMCKKMGVQPLAALSSAMAAARKDNTQPDADAACVGFLAAGHYLIVVQPHEQMLRPAHKPPTAAERQHDRAMLEALGHVSFGRFNNNDQFVSAVRRTGVNTPRQRWWLTTLVVRHRRQLPQRFAHIVEQAQAWLRNNPEPNATVPPAGEPVPATTTAQPQPTKPQDPTLFP